MDDNEQIGTPSISLLPRLVPQPLWGLTGRRKLASTKWEKIRRIVIAEAHGACEVCGETREKGMIVDEVWSYVPGRAILTGLRLLCPPCNDVTHPGNSRSRGVTDEQLVAHCARVNRISEKDAAHAIEGAFATWHDLHSEPYWHVSVIPSVLEQFPDMAILDGIAI
jgi:hypothetical protein